jgi:hypothetical protein
MSESLGHRTAKRKALDAFAEEAKKSEHASKKRIVAKKLRKDVDDLADLFGQMKSSTDEPTAVDVSMDGQGRRRRRTRKHKKSRKHNKSRKH